MLETEPHNNRQSEPSEPENSGQQNTGQQNTGQQNTGQQQNSGHEGGLRRGLLRRGRRAVSRPAGPPTFKSGAADPEQGGGQGRGSGQDAGGGAVPVVPAVPGATGRQPAHGQAAPGGQSGGARSAAAGAQPPAAGGAQAVPAAAFQPPEVVFQPPAITERPAAEPAKAASSDSGSGSAGGDNGGGDNGDEGPGGSRRRRRGGRGRGKGATEAGGQGDGQSQAGRAGANAERGDAAGGQRGGGAGRAGSGARDDAAAADGTGVEQSAADGEGAEGEGGSSSRRRRRRRQRTGAVVPGGEVPAVDEPADTVVHVREARPVSDDDVRAVKGSTRLEAKRQRRREGRDTGRRRPPVISESEFLARREAVERVMAVRQRDDRTQIAVLEDGVLVEHYVDRASHQSYVGNVYLGKVQNVLPSMEAAFVDIGKGRNAVLYAGEVNFDASGLEGVAKRIESALKSGQPIMVQVTKDPIGHKGARLTSQVSLPGRYLVYVPGASMTGISRKLPDTERNRLKQILKKVAPEEGGIIVRTAAEGASEEELQHDVTRLVAQWQAIERKARTASAPDLLYGEPDLTIRVVRDIFNEDFTKLVIASDSEWDLVDEYVRYVAPNLAERMERWNDEADLFSAYRIDEQLSKALDRKVWLPSGGSLVIDTTEAMTVIDVNTGKFTGQGGNLEQTVTRNNLEAAEEIVRQLRLRDIGGIIVIDFIDMVLESNRDLVLRRLIECLARDRTKHQVAEVTSLGLVQMTRKRVGSGLLSVFSVQCEHCNGRGILVSGELTELPQQHGKNGQQGGSAKSGQGRTRSARSKAAIAQVAKSIEPGSTEAQADGEAAGGAVEAAAGDAETAEAGAANGGAANGGAAKSGAAKSGAAKSGAAKSEAADGGASNGGASNGGASNGGAANGGSARGGRGKAGSGRSGRNSSSASMRPDSDAAAPGENGRAAAAATVSPAGAAADGEAAVPPTAVPPTAVPAAPPAAQKRRPRRSAHREAGPPDAALAATAAAVPAETAGVAAGVSPGQAAEPVLTEPGSPAAGVAPESGKASEPAGRGSEPAGKASEPAVKEPEPAGRGSEPAGRGSEPAGKEPEPAREEPEPARKGSEPASAEPASPAAQPAAVEPAAVEPAAVEPAAVGAGRGGAGRSGHRTW